MAKESCICNFQLSGVSLTEFGLKVPSPFCSLELSNSEISSYTSWTLIVTVGGDSTKKVNVAAFEALLYDAAQANSYADSSGIPVSFLFGWLDKYGNVDRYLSYQGYTLKFEVSTSGMFMTYTITGYASLAIKSSMPVLNIPALTGFVQPSAVVEAIAIASKANYYYELDIDHSDSPTLVNHNAMTTSFTSYVRGNRTGQDDYDTFPGLVNLAKSYNATRSASGLVTSKAKKLSQLMNNLTVTPLSNYLTGALTDSTPQSSSFAFWIDEPTMTKPGIIHFKDRASILSSFDGSTLEYGTAHSNILSISGSYNGIAYSMSDMNFSNLGFTVDSEGNSLVNDARVVNSWSSSIASVYQSANIINDINALATQFSGGFVVTVPGSPKEYTICQPISLIVMSGNTLSPVSGIYNIVSVSHRIATTFTTTLKLQRLAISSANQVAAGNGIYVSGSSQGQTGTYTPTSNVISTSKVNFGIIYPDWTMIGNVGEH